MSIRLTKPAGGLLQPLLSIAGALSFSVTGALFLLEYARRKPEVSPASLELGEGCESGVRAGRQSGETRGLLDGVISAGNGVIVLRSLRNAWFSVFLYLKGLVHARL